MTKFKRTTHKAKGFSEEQTQGFCLLPNSHSAIAIANRLTGSQFRLWHYLMMIDSFADRSRDGEKIFREIPSCADIAEAIGSSPRTVEKDMKRLEELGLYAKRVTSWQGYNLTAEEGRRVADQMKLKSRNQQPEPLQDRDGYLTTKTAKQPKAALNNRQNGKITEEAVKQPEVALNSRNQSLEPLQRNTSSAPQTYSNSSYYSNFIQTLSNSERENFEKFVKEEWKKHKGEDIFSMERFLSSKENCDNWYQKFLLSDAGKDFKWANHPQRALWLAEIERTGNPGMFASGDKEKQSFIKWCRKTKQYSWLKKEDK